MSEQQRRPRPTLHDRRRNLINAGDAALYFKRAHNVAVKPETVRQWASRRHIGSYGYGRQRYDLREIVEYARSRGIIPGT